MASFNVNCTCTPAEDLHTSQGSLPRHGAHRARGKQFGYLKLGTWNVRSMVDTEGSVDIASCRQDRRRGEQRKVDLVVEKINRYNAKVVSLKETKWFGNEMYKVGNAVVLTCGRVRLLMKNIFEGVAVVLLDRAIDAWKAAGSQWKAWSFRLISVTLKCGDKRLHVTFLQELQVEKRKQSFMIQ